MAARPTHEEIVAYFGRGLLAKEMAREFGVNAVEAEKIQASCAELHNKGAIDLFQLVENGDIQALLNSDFLCRRVSSAAYFLN